VRAAIIAALWRHLPVQQMTLCTAATHRSLLEHPHHQQAVCRLYVPEPAPGKRARPKWFPAFGWHDARDLYSSYLFPKHGPFFLMLVNAIVCAGVVLATIFEFVGDSELAPYADYGALLVVISSSSEHARSHNCKLCKAYDKLTLQLQRALPPVVVACRCKLHKHALMQRGCL
jgi:hypothetical protein